MSAQPYYTFSVALTDLTRDSEPRHAVSSGSSLNAVRSQLTSRFWARGTGWDADGAPWNCSSWELMSAQPAVIRSRVALTDRTRDSEPRGET